MANSGTVTAGSAALASQYNNLRDDVLNIVTGHGHSGVGEDGKAIVSGGILKYEEFTSSGSFVIPANASSSAVLMLEVLNPGSGGASGAVAGVGTAGNPGAGGAGGAFGVFTSLVSQYGTANGTVTVTIGAGGAGGTGNNTAGGRGGITSFGSAEFYANTNAFDGYPMPLANGFHNTKGNTAANLFAQGAGTTTALPDLGDSGLFLISGGRGGGFFGGTAYSGFDSGSLGAGGGAGGNPTAGTANTPGQPGGKRYGVEGKHLSGTAHPTGLKVGNGGAGGTGAGGAGGTAASSGGGGGAHNQSGVGGAGAAGDYGCGGGGGGGARTGNASGAGGAGGNGRVRVWVIG